MHLALCTLHKTLITLAVIFALVAVGFAHRHVSEPLSPALADFVAAGGSLADICGDFDGQGPAGPTTCEACRIAGSANVANDCPSMAIKELGKVQTLGFLAKRLRQSQGLDASRLTRAPPQA